MKVKNSQPSVINELCSLANEIERVMTAHNAPSWLFRPTLRFISWCAEGYNKVR